MRWTPTDWAMAGYAPRFRVPYIPLATVPEGKAPERRASLDMHFWPHSLDDWAE